MPVDKAIGHIRDGLEQDKSIGMVQDNALCVWGYVLPAER